MGNAALHKDRLVQAAVRLFREQGYAATGLSQILQLSGAPKGSLYYYFPAGKEALAEAAVTEAARVVTQTLSRLADTTANPGEFIGAYAAMLSEWMAQSGFRSGCPITTTLLETVPDSKPLSRACAHAINEWIGLIADVYKRDGLSPGVAREQAEFVISALEGALIQARVQCSVKPIKRAATQLARLSSQLK